MSFTSLTNKFFAFGVDDSEILWTSGSQYLWHASTHDRWYISTIPGVNLDIRNTTNVIGGTWTPLGVLYTFKPVYKSGTEYLWYDGTNWIISGMVGGLVDETEEVTATTVKSWDIGDGEPGTHSVSVDARDELSWTLDNATHDSEYPVFTPVPALGEGEVEGPLTPGTWEFNVTGIGGCSTDKAILILEKTGYTGDGWWEGPTGIDPRGEYTPRGSLYGNDPYFVTGTLSGKIRNDTTGSTAPWGEYLDYSLSSEVVDNGDGTYSIEATATESGSATGIGDPVYVVDEETGLPTEEVDYYTNLGKKSDIYAFEIAQWLEVV